MATISLCMIVKNEEAVLARCLDGIKDAVDEIIIVDTGSTDATKEVARKYTEKIYDFAWVNDFSAARNAAFAYAKCDYQMWLDADDVFPPESLQALLQLKENLDSAVDDIVTMKYVIEFDADGKPVQTSTRERLIRRGKGYKWIDPVHECIPLVGNVKHTDIEVHHKKQRQEEASRRNLEIYEGLEKNSLSPRQLYYYARELKDHGMWIKSAYYFEKFLATKQGWAEDNIAACTSLSVCYTSMGDTEKILPILLKSFEYDAPRPESCCKIGYYYKNAAQYPTALKWFQLAANIEPTPHRGFHQADYHGYIPNIESCVCCCAMQDFESAKKYNEQAASYKPNAAAVAINRKYLAEML